MRKYPPERRAEAVALAAREGVAEAARRLDIPKGTISKWCTADGIETVSPERRNQVEGTKLAAEARRAIVAERMWEIADRASARELELLKASDLRSVVGARTRAIHDAELLSGRATNRTEHVEPIDAELQRLAAEIKARA